MEGGEETLRARETEASVLPGSLHFVAFMFAQNLQFCIFASSKTTCDKLFFDTNFIV
jgi:hypothetical protein